MTVRKEVLWFASRMEAKLAKNDHKAHWEGSDFGYLIRRLMNDETRELVRALHPMLEMEAGMAKSAFVPTQEQIESVIDEAADIANFAMMIADNARQFGREVTVVVYGEPTPVRVYPDEIMADVVLKALRATGHEQPLDRLEFRDATGRWLFKTDEVPDCEIFVAPPPGHGG